MSCGFASEEHVGLPRIAYPVRALAVLGGVRPTFGKRSDVVKARRVVIGELERGINRLLTYPAHPSIALEDRNTRKALCFTAPDARSAPMLFSPSLTQSIRIETEALVAARDGAMALPLWVVPLA
jgi:hypothetical protein